MFFVGHWNKSFELVRTFEYREAGLMLCGGRGVDLLYILFANFGWALEQTYCLVRNFMWRETGWIICVERGVDILVYKLWLGTRTKANIQSTSFFRKKGFLF